MRDISLTILTVISTAPVIKICTIRSNKLLSCPSQLYESTGDSNRRTYPSDLLATTHSYSVWSLSRFIGLDNSRQHGGQGLPIHIYYCDLTINLFP